MDNGSRFDHPERMNRDLLVALTLATLAGCGGSPTPTKSIEVPTDPAPQYISASGQSPRPIYDYNVAPAQYSLKPLENWTEQEAAAEALGRIGPAALPQLVELLKSPQADVRLIAAQVIARMGSDAKEAVPALIPLLNDPDERVRKAATRTLGRIGPDAAAAVPELLEALVESESASPEGEVRRATPP
jgi:HEAT repeat protein